MRRSTARCVLLMGVLSLSGLACDDKNEGPPLSPSPNPAPPPAPVLVGLTLTGNVNLSAVGETSQLTVTANYSDGSTKDVSKETRWTIGDRRVVTVSTEGLLTVVGFGRTSVFVSYSNRNAFTTVTATPPGTFVISGRVREPGQGGVLDATITDRATGLSAMANCGRRFFACSAANASSTSQRHQSRLRTAGTRCDVINRRRCADPADRTGDSRRLGRARPACAERPVIRRGRRQM